MDRSDADLLAATAAGDDAAFADLYRRHEQAVTRYMISRCTNPHDVADGVSETFHVALRSAGRYQAAADTARPWLLGIATRVAMRQQRRAWRAVALTRRLAGRAPRYTPDEADAILSAIDAARLSSSLETAVRALPDGEREVLELVVHGDLTPAEVALALGITPNAARVRLARARSRLRTGLAVDEPPRPTPQGGPSHVS